MDPDPLSNTLLSVWQQVMAEGKDQVQLGDAVYTVGKTGGKRLRKVEFQFEGRSLIALEQNPRTTSQWARMARRGARIMQFKEANRYLANVADGKVHLYE